ncbi:MAG: hypothetical protein VYB59_17690, partial [Pseudomonadota bacterium]|nr:hypothetical protein [Pseudomonadota bacterium]
RRRRKSAAADLWFAGPTPIGWGSVGLRICVPNSPWDNPSAAPIIDTMNEAGHVRCDRHH